MAFDGGDREVAVIHTTKHAFHHWIARWWVYRRFYWHTFGTSIYVQMEGNNRSRNCQWGAGNYVRWDLGVSGLHCDSDHRLFGTGPDGRMDSAPEHKSIRVQAMQVV